jgi:hypothetical protein
MRRFQPSGIRRDRGFQAVTNTAVRASIRASNASIGTERRPIRIITASTA